mgnify:CR=1 FL=1
MSEKKEKNYLVSSIKAVTTQYGQLFNCAMKKEDLDAIEKNGWVSLTNADRREHYEMGVTHYAFENTYEPNQKESEKIDVRKAKEDDLPF